MKVLHINFSDPASGSGGAIAMNWLQEGLCHLGVDSRTLCGRAARNDNVTQVIPRHHAVENAIRRVTRRLGLNDIHCVSSFGLRRLPIFREADVLHFHILHSGYFNYLALPILTKNKPAVFTLHDMWPVTGHCAYSFDCGRWRIGCGSCPHPHAEPPVLRDGSALEWKAKKWCYRRSRLVAVAPSRWLTDIAVSGLFGLSGIKVHHISNGIDTRLFTPLDRSASKSALGVDPSRPLVFFAAANLKDWRKGMDLLASAIKILDSVPFSLAAMGAGLEDPIPDFNRPVLYFGYLSDICLKQLAYSAADLVVVPTRADNQPCILLEAMACSTPCVAFDTGGVRELILHGQTGYLARAEDVADLAQGIENLLRHPEQRRTMGCNARAHILRYHDLTLQSAAYERLYRELVSNRVR